MKKETVIVEVTFTESALRGKPPIARLDDGKMCLLHHSHNINDIRPGETWRCKIIAEEKSKVIIIPVELIKSKEENKELFQQKLNELKLKFA